MGWCNDGGAVVARESVKEMEAIEIRYWATSETERPGVFAIDNVVNKITDAPVLLERLAPFRSRFASAARVLELGAGQGWASCLLRALQADRGQVVVCADISQFALRSVPMWQDVFRTTITGATACRSYELPFASETFDAVFTFQAAHHFRLHRETLREIKRILTPRGLAVYMHEPSCARWIHPVAVRRVRALRQHVPEDLIVHEEMVKCAREEGLEVSSRDDCSLVKRGRVEFIYYLVLGAVRPLRWILPCTRDYIFKRVRAVNGDPRRAST